MKITKTFIALFLAGFVFLYWAYGWASATNFMLDPHKANADLFTFSIICGFALISFFLAYREASKKK